MSPRHGYTPPASLVAAITEAVLGLGGEQRGDEISFRCPVHEDDKPSAYWNKKSAVWHCFACGGRGGALNLASLLDLRWK